MDGLNSWRDQVTTAETPMVQDQSNIGWTGVLEGILGRHWEDEQDHFKEIETEATSGSKWAHLIVRKLWKIAWDLWMNRNEEAHRHDDQQELDDLLAQVTDEIQIGTQGYIALQTWFHPTEIRRVQQGDKAYIHSWINAVRARRSRFERRQEISPEFERMRNNLRQFLTVTT